jgi:hypothetical protein
MQDFEIHISRTNLKSRGVFVVVELDWSLLSRVECTGHLRPVVGRDAWQQDIRQDCIPSEAVTSRGTRQTQVSRHRLDNQCGNGCLTVAARGRFAGSMPR